VSDVTALLIQAHHAGLVLDTDGESVAIRGRARALAELLAARKPEVMPYLVPEPDDILRAAMWLGWPEVPGIAGARAAWMAAVRRMTQRRRVSAYRALEVLDG
jgi:hypothetical protein